MMQGVTNTWRKKETLGERRNRKIRVMNGDKKKIRDGRRGRNRKTEKKRGITKECIDGVKRGGRKAQNKKRYESLIGKGESKDKG